MAQGEMAHFGLAPAGLMAALVLTLEIGGSVLVIAGQFETVVGRPPMIWGAGMPTLDHRVEVVRAGQFRWPGDGSQPMSTAHVDKRLPCARAGRRDWPWG